MDLKVIGTGQVIQKETYTHEEVVALIALRHYQSVSLFDPECSREDSKRRVEQSFVLARDAAFDDICAFEEYHSRGKK